MSLANITTVQFVTRSTVGVALASEASWVQVAPTFRATGRLTCPDWVTVKLVSVVDFQVAVKVGLTTHTLPNILSS